LAKNDRLVNGKQKKQRLRSNAEEKTEKKKRPYAVKFKPVEIFEKMA
jgi:hypothetical protein